MSEQSRISLSKNLIRPLPVQDRWGRWFWRPTLPIADARQLTEWSSLDGSAAKATKSRCVGIFRDCSYIATSVAAARIYREDPPRVTAFHNWLGLSLLKRIRHGLIAKINGKRRSWTCEALYQTSMDYSRTHRAPAPITSPRLALARWGEVSKRARVFLSFSLLHTLASASRATHLISRLSSTSTSKVGLKSCHPPCMNGALRFIRNY
jgi:hypothetical protein